MTDIFIEIFNALFFYFKRIKYQYISKLLYFYFFITIMFK